MTQQEKMDFPITLRVQSYSYMFSSGQAQFVASTLNFQTIQIWRKKLLKVYALASETPKEIQKLDSKEA